MRATVLCVLIALASGAFKDNTEFDEKIKEILRTQFGVNSTTFLKRFVDERGFPQSLMDPKQTGPPFCADISGKYVTDEKYSECSVITSAIGNTSRTVLDISEWSGFNVFRLAVNIRELKNVELRLESQQELTYLYFTSFQRCENCLFRFIKNPSLVGARFGFFEVEANAEATPPEYRPRLFIRGNSRLKLSEEKKIWLRQGCNPEQCDIQQSEECYFRDSIRKQEEYKNCHYVYGDMVFTERFQTVQPEEPDFWIEGCFHFNRTGIRVIRTFLRAHPHCPKEHVFFENKYMCTDHIEELKLHWGEHKIRVISNLTAVNCYQGECRGGFLAQKNENLYSGCEIVQGDLYVSEKSGNVSERIRDLSNIHEIRGQFQLVNNPSITTLALPFLRSINSSKCPALSILNMKNLRNIIFHPTVVFQCHGDGPKVLIHKSPKVYLHSQMLTNMKENEYEFQYFDYDINHYHFDTITIVLIIGSMILIMIVECIAAARRNMLLPNSIYQRFPLDVKQRPRQKPVNKNKTE